MNLTTNFTLAEFLASKVADKYHIDNSHYTNPQKLAMVNLCDRSLEPLRAALRRKIHPRAVVVLTSGLRCPALNKKVGGVPTSGHLKGEAADIHVEDWKTGERLMSTQELFDFILAEGILFDQLINEYDQWVHISLKRGHIQRKQSFYMWVDKSGHKQTTTKKPPPDMVLNILGQLA